MNLEDFINKKILIFCPHQDDEINIAGGLLLKLKKVNCDIKIVYSTNGDWNIDGNIRMKEAMNSLKVLGVKKENIIFLGYPDCYQENETHIYMTNKIYYSKNGNNKTYLPKGEEYHYKKYGEHATLNKLNFISDIKDLIEEETADIIICIDYDEHCDHRALSLSVEKAIGLILKENNKYTPTVLKAFAYPTYFYGKKDFKSHTLGITTFNRSKYSKYNCNNPYYDWNERISIDIRNEVKSKLLITNRLFRAMKKHISQDMHNKAYSIINADQVFFLRRTDNLLINAKIRSSSGNINNINDFMLFDTSNVMHGDTSEPIIDEGYLEFDTNEQKHSIIIDFQEEKTINEINIYKYVNCSTELKKIKVIANNEKEFDYNIKEENFKYRLKDIQLNNVKKIEIIFEQIKEFAITEIEVFEQNTPKVNTSLNIQKNKQTLSDKIIFAINDIIIHYYNFYFRNLKKIKTKLKNRGL